MGKRLLIFVRVWLLFVFFGVYVFESASAIPSHVETIGVATDGLPAALTNKSVAQIGKEMEERYTIIFY